MKTARRHRRLRRLWNAERRLLRNGLRWSAAHPRIEGVTVGSVVGEYATLTTWRLHYGAPA